MDHALEGAARELETALRLHDLLAAVRMSWDEMFDLPEPRPLSSSAA